MGYYCCDDLRRVIEIGYHGPFGSRWGNITVETRRLDKGETPMHFPVRHCIFCGKKVVNYPGDKEEDYYLIQLRKNEEEKLRKERMEEIEPCQI